MRAERGQLCSVLINTGAFFLEMVPYCGSTQVIIACSATIELFQLFFGISISHQTHFKSVFFFLPPATFSANCVITVVSFYG